MAVSKLSFDITNEQELELFHKQLDWFIDFNKQSNSEHFDVHLLMDDNFVEIEYVQIPYASEDNYEGKFVLLGLDEVIMKEEFLPDNSGILVHDDEEFREELTNWLEEHPTWKQDEYGRWYDEAECSDTHDYLDKPCALEEDSIND